MRGGASGAMEGCDWLVHLAGPASAAELFSSPENYFATHAVGSAAVFNAANRAGWSGAFCSPRRRSTAAPTVDPVPEGAGCNPLSPYGAAKLAAEWAARTLTDSNSARLHVVRPFSVFGPGMRANSLVASIVLQAGEKSEVRLHNPRVVRDYIHVSDLTDLIAALIRAGDAPDILNACSGRGIAAEALGAAALRACGAPTEVRALGVADRPTDIERLVGDPKLALRTLNWRTRFDVESWIARELVPCLS